MTGVTIAAMKTIQHKHRLEAEPRASGAVFVKSGTSGNLDPIHLEQFDALILVVTDHEEPVNHISHYIEDSMRLQERWIHKSGLRTWILNGGNRNIIQWILNGEILFDKDHFLHGLRQTLIEFPAELREQKVLIEFSRFLRCYLQSRDQLRKGHIFDAHINIVRALEHWGHIAIIEQGIHPEMMVWAQVRDINLGIYKLYEELMFSEEPMEKRVELMQIACEFAVISKMKTFCRLLIRVLESREEPWSAVELKEHPLLKEMRLDLALVLQKMAARQVIREVHVPMEGTGIREIRYTV